MSDTDMTVSDAKLALKLAIKTVRVTHRLRGDTLETVLNRHADVFKDELGTMNGFGDFKVTINPALCVEHDPITRIDLFASLAGDNCHDFIRAVSSD